MALLVTGGAGYIGSHMAWELVDAGHEVVVLDDLSTGFESAVPPCARLLKGDVADPAVLRRLFEDNAIEAIFHCAARTVVPDSVAVPLEYYLNNSIKFHALLTAAVAANVKGVIFSSTAAVYEPLDVNPVTEAGRLAPASPYGASKLFAERMLTDVAAASGMSAIVLRYFNVAGADPAGRVGQSTEAATHLIKSCCQAAVGTRDGITIFGEDFATPDGTGVRDYIHVSDLVAIHRLALQRMARRPGVDVFNCGYGHGYSVREVIAATKRVSGVDFRVSVSPRRPGDLGSVVANPARARAEFGWHPRFDDLDTIIEHALAWERKLAR